MLFVCVYFSLSTVKTSLILAGDHAEIGQYGLRMTDISENCPKQERTLAVCHRVLSCAREYPAYLEQLIMKHSGGFEPFTKVTAPLGSIAQACRFKSCRAHHDWVTKKMSPNFFQYSCGFAGFLEQNPKNGFTVDVQTANRNKIRQSGASA